MYRYHFRMSSIEEEDESELSDELVTQIERLPPIPLSQEYNQPSSPSILEWDSEISESEQEFEDNNEHAKNNCEQLAANRVLQNFIQSCSSSHQNSTNENNVCNSPFTIHLYDDGDDSNELNILTSDLLDFQYEFDRKTKSEQKSTMASSFSPSTCVSELRTLEDQLEAALASLTMTINDCSIGKIDCPQVSSSNSSASSSGLGDEISNESYHLYNSTHQTNSSLASKLTTTDDCDSAYSDSCSNEKVPPDESIIYRSIINPIDELPLNILDADDCLLAQSQHPSKILVRTYNDDGSTKSILVDDSMLVRDVLFLLIHKNHREPDVNYAIVEILPDLHMERIFEDHQKLTEAILMWPTVSSNRLRFTKRFEKYDFFRTLNSPDQLFETGDVEGNIYLKEKSRKSWKKCFCVLRSSGLYYIPKGKSKKELVCLAKLENVELFSGFDWKKKFKSPSDFCFALKHPLIQKKSSKYIKYMCVETELEFDRWTRHIRIAKFNQQIKINYLFMEKAMNIYRSSGRFINCSQMSIIHRSQDDLSLTEHRAQIPSNQYYTINSSTADEKEIQSASYMDELRQRLERVLEDPTTPMNQPKESHSRPTLIPPPKIKSINSPFGKSNEKSQQTSVGSTPLPRKQIQVAGSLSYRTLSTINRHPQQQQMSQSFIVSSKRDLDSRTSSSLSDTSSSIKSLNLKKPFTPSNEVPLTPILSKQAKLNATSTFNSNNRQVPPIPPRKSSIPRSSVKPQLPERNSSANILLRKSNISHL